MNRIFCVGLLAAGALLLQGCATSSSVSYEPAPGHKVGVLNLVEETYTHTHVGTTVFNNKVTSHSHSQINVHDYINASVAEELEMRSLEAVFIDQQKWPGLADSSLVSMGWSDYRIRPGKLEEIQRVMAQQGLSLLLVFESFDRQDHVGGSSVHIGGYGLYTRSFLGVGATRAYANVWGYGIKSDPAEYVAAGGTRTIRDVEFREIDDSTIQDLEIVIQPIIEEIVSSTFENVGLD